MKKTQNIILLLVLLAAGLLLGNLLGEVTRVLVTADSKLYQAVFSPKTVGFAPVKIDLGLFIFTIGFLLKINLISAIGIIAAFLIWRKL